MNQREDSFLFPFYILYPTNVITLCYKHLLTYLSPRLINNILLYSETSEIWTNAFFISEIWVFYVVLKSLFKLIQILYNFFNKLSRFMGVQISEWFSFFILFDQFYL